ncbi:flagellar basal body P-ring protein FlgI [Frateuria aurantia]|uniref:Flagellar P-ring protein n=1 Tax=Frateuria aurantia (strain ATCC 33424 / DSM 6220 / KCTC 2777 / LMG 1558 / NBRC 3245 / NCIMB 13370) TaxID=767434 RepID=H8L3C6_FRAAD|nr:flagellar basal body P-ring protein FlgI [Frateuria aurantia]AFC86448.1 flagellar basal-body P-ring protein [Frateuria aurantia DSM 6220]
MRATGCFRGALVLLTCLATGIAHAERITDIAQVAGSRSNQLVGYGLAVGLDNSGDQTTQVPFTTQSITNMLQQFGINIPANMVNRTQLRNSAAVMVTAELPPFAKPGQAIDVTVASIGNARSLRGGELLLTPLHGADGEVYAMAQGSVAIGGINGQGASGSSVQINISNSGRIPAGATVERAVPTMLSNGGMVRLNLYSPNFETAARVANAINAQLGRGTAVAQDAATIVVRAPADPGQTVAYLATIEAINVTPADAPAKVIVNSRTGTVVINSTVQVSPAAVSHGSITVTISENPQVSQPGAFSGGQTAIVPQSSVDISENGAHMFRFGPGVDLNQIVRAVNEVGATPSDLISILQALKEAGALHAQLIVI